MENLTVRDEIAAAISDGLSNETEMKPAVVIFVKGSSQEPIIVMDDDLILPPAFKALAPGIRLDVQAILAERG